jgi:hypothetical protein
MELHRDRNGRFISIDTNPKKRSRKKPKSKSKSKSKSKAKTKEKEVVEESYSIRLLKKTVKDLKRKIEGLASGDKLITEAVEQAYEDPPDLYIPKSKKDTRKRKNEEIAVLHLSDLHIGKLTSSYDTAMAEERLMLLAKKVNHITEVRRSSSKIDELRIYLGGDMIEGEDIFATQAHLIDQSLFDQAVKNGPAIIAKCILALSEAFPRIHICTVPGNHGRNGPKGSRSHPRTNWDNVCYEVLKIYLLGSNGNRKETKNRITMEISEEFYIVDRVYEWGNLMVHGHEIRGGFAGLPWYGVAKKAWGWIDSIPVPWDYLWFGHFHTYASATLNHRIFLANGTIESDNEFAQQNMSAAGFPCQRLCFFDEKNGLISDNQVYLTSSEDRVPSRIRGHRS